MQESSKTASFNGSLLQIPGPTMKGRARATKPEPETGSPKDQNIETGLRSPIRSSGLTAKLAVARPFLVLRLLSKQSYIATKMKAAYWLTSTSLSVNEKNRKPLICHVQFWRNCFNKAKQYSRLLSDFMISINTGHRHKKASWSPSRLF